MAQTESDFDPQGMKNIHNFLQTVRHLTGHVAEMLLILKKNYFPPDYSRGSLIYDRPKKFPTILYAVDLWLKPVSIPALKGLRRVSSFIIW